MATIFVYGTLLEGCRNYDRLLKGRVRSIQTAYVQRNALFIERGGLPGAGRRGFVYPW